MKCIYSRSLKLSVIYIFVSCFTRPYRKKIHRSSAWCNLGWSNNENLRFRHSKKILCGCCSGMTCGLKLCQIMVILLTHILYQLCPLQRPLKWETAVTFPSPAAKSFAFRVVSGQTLELVISQFWSSGIGSPETASVDFEVTEFLWRYFPALWYLDRLCCFFFDKMRNLLHFELYGTWWFFLLLIVVDVRCISLYHLVCVVWWWLIFFNFSSI